MKVMVLNKATGRTLDISKEYADVLTAQYSNQYQLLSERTVIAGEDEEEAYWKGVSEDAEARKKARTAINIDNMQAICIDLNVDCDEFNANSYRLTKKGFVPVDYFPPSGRLHVHNEKRWHTKTADLLRIFLTKHFKSKP